MLLHSLDKKITNKIIQNIKIQTGNNFNNKSSKKKQGYYSFSDTYFHNNETKHKNKKPIRNTIKFKNKTKQNTKKNQNQKTQKYNPSKTNKN